MISPASRIIARYIASALATAGLISMADISVYYPEIVALVGAVLAAVSEVFYRLAKKRGWAL